MSDYYKIIPLKENIYRITSPENVFCELLIGEEKALLIDTGYGFGDLNKVVKDLTNKPLIIVNTHGHLDHVCGNDKFEETVFIGQEDMELCQLHTAKELRLIAAKNAEHVFDYYSGTEGYGLPEDFSQNQYLSLGSGKLAKCEEGDIFDLGGMTIRVYSTPGHTLGGRSFYYEEEQWLYVGDAANPFLWLFMPEATDRNTHIASLDKILSLEVQRIYGGHNPYAMTLEDIKLFKKVAIMADYEKGIPFSNPIVQNENARICIIEGMSMEDMMKPGFASIVISSDK